MSPRTLDRYAAKRKFTRTPEPAVPKGPSLDPADKRMAVEVEDHPFEYGSFEGVIPEKEYGAGNVIVWDCGAYSPDEGGQYAFTDRPAAEARVRAELAAGKLSFFLCGEKLKGSFTLVKTRTANQWLLIKHKDRFAQANDVLARSHRCASRRPVLHRAVRRKSFRRILRPCWQRAAMERTLSPAGATSPSSTVTGSSPSWRAIVCACSHGAGRI